jgi:hypothetical protein
MPTRSFITGAGLGSVLGLTAVVALTGCSPTTLSTDTAHAAVRAVDWSAVGQTLGTPLKVDQDGVYNADMPRDDLHVTVAGVQLRPGMDIGSEVHFLPTGNGRALLVGELTVTDAEQGKVIDDLQRGGLELTAIHKHLPAQTPDLWWIQFTGHATANAEAAAVHNALTDTGTPPRRDPDQDSPSSGLDLATLDSTLGLPHSSAEGTYHYRLPTVMPIFDTRARRRLPPAMDTSTLLMFQPLGNDQAAATGDVVLTVHQINPVVSALRAGGIQIVTLHNHMLDEIPRLFYLHYWAVGDATAIARTLREALHKIRID